MATAPTRRRFALVVARLLFSVVLLAAVSSALAQDRTYNIVDYPVNEIDFNTGAQDSVSGTIVTDGALGALTRSDIIGGTLTLSGNNESFASDQSWFAGQSLGGPITATLSQLTFSAGDIVSLQAGSGAATLGLSYWGYDVGEATYQGLVGTGTQPDPIEWTVTDPSPASSQSITHYYPFVIASGGQPTTPSWAYAVSGSWSDRTKWTAGVVPVNAAVTAAVFNVPTSSALTITLDNPQTVGTLQFGNSGNTSAGYTLSGNIFNTLTLNNSGGGATITVTDGTHVIDAPVVLADNLVVTTGSTNPWTLSFGTASSITDNGSGYSLTMNGAGGTLILSGSNDYTGGTIVEAGTLYVTASDALPDGGSLIVDADGTMIFGASQAVASTMSSLSASQINPVPEPSTLALLSLAGIIAAAAWRRRRNQADL